MRTVAGVVSGRRGGVFRLASDDAAAVERAAAAAGRRLVRVDLSTARTKDDALAALARALAFPEWFGGNWDALQDSLADLSWLEGDGWVLHVAGVDAFAASAPAEVGPLVDVLRRAARTWADEGKPFVALLRGAERLSLPAVR